MHKSVHENTAGPKAAFTYSFAVLNGLILEKDRDSDSSHWTQRIFFSFLFMSSYDLFFPKITSPESELITLCLLSQTFYFRSLFCYSSTLNCHSRKIQKWTQNIWIAPWCLADGSEALDLKCSCSCSFDCRNCQVCSPKICSKAAVAHIHEYFLILLLFSVDYSSMLF